MIPRLFVALFVCAPRLTFGYRVEDEDIEDTHAKASPETPPLVLPPNEPPPGLGGPPGEPPNKSHLWPNGPDTKAPDLLTIGDKSTPSQTTTFGPPEHVLEIECKSRRREAFLLSKQFTEQCLMPKGNTSVDGIEPQSRLLDLQESVPEALIHEDLSMHAAGLLTETEAVLTKLRKEIRRARGPVTAEAADARRASGRPHGGSLAAVALTELAAERSLSVEWPAVCPTPTSIKEFAAFCEMARIFSNAAFVINRATCATGVAASWAAIQRAHEEAGCKPGGGDADNGCMLLEDGRGCEEAAATGGDAVGSELGDKELIEVRSHAQDEHRSNPPFAAPVAFTDMQRAASHLQEVQNEPPSTILTNRGYDADCKALLDTAGQVAQTFTKRCTRCPSEEKPNCDGTCAGVTRKGVAFVSSCRSMVQALLPDGDEAKREEIDNAVCTVNRECSGQCSCSSDAWNISATHDSDWADMGKDTTCKLNANDLTPDGQGSVVAYRSIMSGGGCRMLCKHTTGCFGVEYNEADGWCELWKRPIGAVEHGPPGYRCWKFNGQSDKNMSTPQSQSQLTRISCCKLAQQFEVEPGKDFGVMKDQQREWWNRAQCSTVVGGAGLPTCQKIGMAPLVKTGHVVW